jgi:hypothetical protein
MMKRLTKKRLAAVAVISASLLGAAAPSAIADTSTLRLGCFVDSSALDSVTADRCAASEVASQYTVVFEVMGLSGSGYSFDWGTSGFTIAPFGGCTSSFFSCSVIVRARGHTTRTMSVVVTELATGASKRVTATAEFFAVCGRVFC